MADTKKKSTAEQSDEQTKAPAAEVRSDRAARRASSKSTAVSETDRGVTIIHDQVVAKIARMAVREVQGVHRLVAQGTGQQIASMARSVSGGEDRETGIAVEVGQEEVAVDVRIVTEFGVSIPRVAETIRRNVAERIESMTGLRAVEVNIEVADLHFEEEGQGSEAQESSRVQ